jgi:transcriptional regulator with XRE-family HTH domain
LPISYNDSTVLIALPNTALQENTIMVIGERLRELRERKNLSQGDIELRTGLLRCYISRVENGHTVPSIETLEKMACALKVPLYHLFYEGENPPKPLGQLKFRTKGYVTWGASGKQARILLRFRRTMSRIEERDRLLLINLAQKMGARSR